MYIADLHIHSRYSRATSKECTPRHLELWARRKGIQVIGTGDFTHPAWREELEEMLMPAEEGMYVLKEEYRIKDGITDDSMKPRFVVTGEISSIYKKDGKVRKVHSVLILPGLAAAGILSGELEAIGNIHSDGRPILGLDCHDLLEIMLEKCHGAVYVPAHIWTPHFSLFGAFSGFDTIEECFGDLSGHIHALETGLSSDPPMNWRLSALDSYNLISNSDAHSPSKLGREANLFDTELSYPGLAAGIQEGKGLMGTLEFFPEEGKYHYDGHRKCHLCLSPAQALPYDGKCPVCGRRLTIGVSHRVEELSDREEGFVLPGARSFESLVPLCEVIGASTGRSAAGAKVQAEYESMLKNLGPEFSILREIPVEEIRSKAGYLISEGIRRLRAGEVERTPGFDGEYGVIKLFEPWEIENLDGQLSLFSREEMEEIFPEKSSVGDQENGDGCAPGETGAQAGEPGAAKRLDAMEPDQTSWDSLNDAQREAAFAAERALAVVAGPGTGKTKTLVARIEYLLQVRRVKPSQITAVTFTEKAAEEMKERLKMRLGKKRATLIKNIGTFHAICFDMLKRGDPSLSLADEETALALAEESLEQAGLKLPPKEFLRRVSLYKTGLDLQFIEASRVSGNPQGGDAGEGDAAFFKAYSHYQEKLKEEGAADFDDLLIMALRLMEAGQTEPGCQETAQAERQKFSYLLVDEFQDISPLQYRLIQSWNREGRELFVIGDPDQSIYGFRGSDARCFERLKEDYPMLRTVRLTLNYRSAPSIVSGALAMISGNPGPVRELLPCREAGRPIRLVTAKSAMAEAVFTAKEINRLIGGIDMLDAQERSSQPSAAFGFSDIAVLYRTHRQADLLEKCLAQEGIPYIIAGRDDFLEEREVRGAVCFFRLLMDPKDTLARRLCEKLLADWDFDELLSGYRGSFLKQKPWKLLERYAEDRNLKENRSLQKLNAMTRFYPSMPAFLNSLSFGEEGDLRRCGEKTYTSDAVTLMTLHAAKGLEFPAVMVCGVREGMIPLKSGKRPSDPEEERRLFYVGMTRAKEELILITSPEESPFLSDIPEGLISREETGRLRSGESAKQLSLFDFMEP